MLSMRNLSKKEEFIITFCYIAMQNTPPPTIFPWNCLFNDGHDLTYVDFPLHFVWDTSGKQGNYRWKPRQKGDGSIGRIYFVSPRAGEKYYLRLLLHHVKGATCWAQLREVNGQPAATFQEACHTEYFNCLFVTIKMQPPVAPSNFLGQ